MACFCDLKKAEILYDHMAVPSLLMTLGFYVENSETLWNKKKIKALGRKAAAVAAKLFQSCQTLCNPIDSSPPGSSIPGILQARTLEWVAIPFFSAWKWKVKVKLLSCVRLLATPWTAVYRAPPTMGFSRQEYWNGEGEKHGTQKEQRGTNGIKEGGEFIYGGKKKH